MTKFKIFQFRAENRNNVKGGSQYKNSAGGLSLLVLPLTAILLKYSVLRILLTYTCVLFVFAAVGHNRCQLHT